MFWSFDFWSSETPLMIWPFERPPMFWSFETPPMISSSEDLQRSKDFTIKCEKFGKVRTWAYASRRC